MGAQIAPPYENMNDISDITGYIDGIVTVAEQAISYMSKELDKIDFSDAVKSQLLCGIDGEGKELSPSYTQDPYFNTEEEAMNWVDKYGKRDVIDIPKWGLKARDWNTPNLIITGSLFYNFITSDHSGGIIETQAVGSPIEAELRGKYGDKILSLSPVVIGKIEKENLIPMLEKASKEYSLEWVADA